MGNYYSDRAYKKARIIMSRPYHLISDEALCLVSNYLENHGLNQEKGKNTLVCDYNRAMVYKERFEEWFKYRHDIICQLNDLSTNCNLQFVDIISAAKRPFMRKYVSKPNFVGYIVPNKSWYSLKEYLDDYYWDFKFEEINLPSKRQGIRNRVANKIVLISYINI